MINPITINSGNIDIIDTITIVTAYNMKPASKIAKQPVSKNVKFLISFIYFGFQILMQLDELGT